MKTTREMTSLERRNLQRSIMRKTILHTGLAREVKHLRTEAALLVKRGEREK